MRGLFAAAAVLAALLFGAPGAGAVQPYLAFEAGVLSRDVVEEDASIAGFSYGGTATSTRVLATVGIDVAGGLTIYAQGGAADLTIDEFNDFDGSLQGAYGGGVRYTMFLSPDQYGLKLFVEASMLHTSADDTVQAEFGCTAANGCTSPGAPGRYLPRLVEESIEWNEYTLLMGAGSRWGPYGPYGGVRLSAVDAEDRLRAAPDANFTREFRADTDLREQDNFGIFFGTDLFLDRLGTTALNFELSLIDQYSFRAGVRRNF